MIYKCKNCGGYTTYNPETGKMHCPFCDTDDSEEKVEGRSLTICPSCGAELQVQNYTSACKCEHCGNYIIFDEKVEGEFEPHLMLPFKVSKNKVKELLHMEFKKKIFLPDSFLAEKKLENIEGIYVPFWLYNYMVNYRFTGKGTKIRVWRSGDTEYTEHKVYSISRDMNIDFEKIPVDASIAMEDGIMDLMEPYDYGSLQAFQAKYMSGFWGEVYNEEASALEGRAKKKVQEDSEEIMRDSMPNYTSIVPECNLMEMNCNCIQYALMPVWRYQYKYRGKEYLFHINGQTGKVIGNTPIALEKVALYGTTVFASVAALSLLIITILEVL